MPATPVIRDISAKAPALRVTTTAPKASSTGGPAVPTTGQLWPRTK